MRFRGILAAGIIAVGLAACTGPAGSPSAGSADPGGGAAAQAAGGSEQAGPVIPKGANWTIVCAMFSGADHARAGRAAREYLLNSTKLREWYLVHGANDTTLYYGYYREIDHRVDPAEAGRAQSDRKTVAALTAQNGDRLFRSVLLVPLDAADPPAPPEWNLLSARSKGTYTLQVGVCKDDPDRKVKVVEAVREARAEGMEAYYYHGPTSSSVCIGVWPENAVRRTIQTEAKDPNVVRMVVPGALNMPEHMTTPDGRPVEVVQEKIEILDRSLLAMLQKFPRQAVNGQEYRAVLDQQQKKRLVPYPSTIVTIPKEEPAAPRTVEAGVATPAPAQPDQGRVPDAKATPPVKTTPAPKGGKLRSIDD